MRWGVGESLTAVNPETHWFVTVSGETLISSTYAHLQHNPKDSLC